MIDYEIQIIIGVVLGMIAGYTFRMLSEKNKQ
jgi:ABC-type dipeptide/oligopeptide/nickel transport system permease subunit